MQTPVPYADTQPALVNGANYRSVNIGSSQPTGVIFSDAGTPLAYADPESKELRALTPESMLAVGAELQYRAMYPAHAERAYIPEYRSKNEPSACPLQCNQRSEDSVWNRTF